MSIRPREAFEASQQFSLHDAVWTDATVPMAAGLPPSQAGNLKFNLGALSAPRAAVPPEQAAPTALVPQPVRALNGLSLRWNATPCAVAEPPKPPSQPLSNLSFASMAQVSGKPHSIMNSAASAMALKEQASTKADVMRLTAYVDELTNRIKKTQSKLEQTEAQLTRTSHVLCQERQVSDMALKGYQKDIAQAHEIEAKLRADIATTKKRTSVHDSAFMASVGSALASDEQIRVQQRNLQELETKVSAMGEFKVKLEAEIAKLTSLHESAQKELEEMRTAREEHAAKISVANAELAVSRTQFDALKADHGSIVERLATAKVEEATLTEAVAALRVAKTKAEQETQGAKSATQAMILEHGDMSNKLRLLRESLEKLQAQECEASSKLEVTRAKCVEAEARLDAPTLSPAMAPCNSMSDLQLEPAADVDCAVQEAKDMGKDDKGDKNDEATEVTAGAPADPCKDGEQDVKQDVKQDEEEDTAAVLTPPVEAACPVAPSPRAPRRGVITGAHAPNRQLCVGIAESVASQGAMRAHERMPEMSVAAMLTLDAPVDLTMQRVGFLGSGHCLFMADTGAAQGTTDPTSQMINAVVGDLKEKLTEISQQQPVWRAVAPLA